mmetsp:Transcript_77383/g.218991  ORF Transcript_77383/g.218991 Transcript_77383/m.218991 type:complete len:246 (+) Transcript_77383:87-824(+)
MQSLLHWRHKDSAKGAKIPLPADDPMLARRKEIAELEALLSLFEATGKAIGDAVARLERAPTQLLDQLGASNFNFGNNAKLMSQVSNQLASLSSSLKMAAPQLEELHEMVKEARQMNAESKTSITSYENAWSAKVLSEQGVEAMAQNTKHNYSMEEKKERLAARLEHAEAFDRCAGVTKLSVHELTERQWAKIGEMLGKVRVFYLSGFKVSASSPSFGASLMTPFKMCKSGTSNTVNRKDEITIK